MKTPDEIKKGLECCLLDDFHCGEGCPYKKICLIEHRYNEIDYDALAYIQQIEAQNAELSVKIGQLQAERDAAVADLKKAANEKAECFGCKWYNEKNCTNKDYKLICSSYDDKWEWRGVQKEYSDD